MAAAKAMSGKRDAKRRVREQASKLAGASRKPKRVREHLLFPGLYIITTTSAAGVHLKLGMTQELRRRFGSHSSRNPAGHLSQVIKASGSAASKAGLKRRERALYLLLMSYAIKAKLAVQCFIPAADSGPNTKGSQEQLWFPEANELEVQLLAAQASSRLLLVQDGLVSVPIGSSEHNGWKAALVTTADGRASVSTTAEADPDEADMEQGSPSDSDCSEPEEDGEDDDDDDPEVLRAPGYYIATIEFVRGGKSYKLLKFGYSMDMRRLLKKIISFWVHNILFRVRYVWEVSERSKSDAYDLEQKQHVLIREAFGNQCVYDEWTATNNDHFDDDEKAIYNIVNPAMQAQDGKGLIFVAVEAKFQPQLNTDAPPEFNYVVSLEGTGFTAQNRPAEISPLNKLQEGKRMWICKMRTQRNCGPE